LALALTRHRTASGRLSLTLTSVLTTAIAFGFLDFVQHVLQVLRVAAIAALSLTLLSAHAVRHVT